MTRDQGIEGDDRGQVGGDHYKHGPDRWELLHFAQERNYDMIQFSMLRYLDRYKRKNGKQDLLKMIDYAEEVIRQIDRGAVRDVSEEERLHGHNFERR